MYFPHIFNNVISKNDIKLYFPILKIIREEISGELKEYTTGKLIDIYVNGKKIKSVDRSEFEKESEELLEEICNAKGSAFQIEKN